MNRVDTKFDSIYTYNFFPTEEGNDVIKLREAAEAKIHAFIEMLQMFTFAFPSTKYLFSEGQSSETVFQSPTFSRCGSMSLTFQHGERRKPMRFAKKF